MWKIPVTGIWSGWTFSVNNKLEVKSLLKNILLSRTRVVGAFLMLIGLLQYLSNPVQVSWYELLRGDSRKTLVFLEVGVQGLEGLQKFEFTVDLSFYILKGLFRGVFTQILFVRFFKGLTQLTLGAELTKKQNVRVKMARR